MLKGASYGESGELREINYECDLPALENFRNLLHDWLKTHQFPLNFFIINSGVSLHCFDKLSDEQISDFMDSFESINMNYEVSCSSNEVTYRFS